MLSQFGRFTVSSSVAAAMIAGCGGSQSPIGAPGGMPQTSRTAMHTDRVKSWMLPEAASEDLVYAPGGCSGTCVFSYPNGKFVGSLSTDGWGICSDTDGNVFIPDGNQVVEYAHAGTTPISTFSVPGEAYAGCAIDPATHNLAVIFLGGGGDVAIFSNAQARATLYRSGIELSRYCGYDNEGNLFVDGFAGKAYGLSELPAGASNFNELSVSQEVGEPGQVQWDGHYITWESMTVRYAAVSQLSISGSEATIESTSQFKRVRQAWQSWIYGNDIIIPYTKDSNLPTNLAIFKYPQGGEMIKSIHDFGPYEKRTNYFQGATLSVAPP
jgi:hypothetical protein